MYIGTRTISVYQSIDYYLKHITLSSLKEMCVYVKYIFIYYLLIRWTSYRLRIEQFDTVQ